MARPPAAAAQVQHRGVPHLRTQDGEHGLLDAVGGGPHPVPAGRQQDPAPPLSGDDPHQGPTFSFRARILAGGGSGSPGFLAPLPHEAAQHGQTGQFLDTPVGHGQAKIGGAGVQPTAAMEQLLQAHPSPGTPPGAAAPRVPPAGGRRNTSQGGSSQITTPRRAQQGNRRRGLHQPAPGVQDQVARGPARTLQGRHFGLPEGRLPFPGEDRRWSGPRALRPGRPDEPRTGPWPRAGACPLLLLPLAMKPISEVHMGYMLIHCGPPGSNPEGPWVRKNRRTRRAFAQSFGIDGHLALGGHQCRASCTRR